MFEQRAHETRTTEGRLFFWKAALLRVIQHLDT